MAVFVFFFIAVGVVVCFLIYIMSTDLFVGFLFVRVCLCSKHLVPFDLHKELQR